MGWPVSRTDAYEYSRSQLCIVLETQSRCSESTEGNTQGRLHQGGAAAPGYRRMKRRLPGIEEADGSSRERYRVKGARGARSRLGPGCQGLCKNKPLLDTWDSLRVASVETNEVSPDVSSAASEVLFSQEIGAGSRGLFSAGFASAFCVFCLMHHWR